MQHDSEVKIIDDTGCCNQCHLPLPEDVDNDVYCADCEAKLVEYFDAELENAGWAAQ